VFGETTRFSKEGRKEIWGRSNKGAKLEKGRGSSAPLGQGKLRKNKRRERGRG